MPLSEREQQLLEQMERALYAEDPRFASTLGAGADGVRRRRRYLVAAAIILVGLAIVVAAVMLESVWLGVVGFLAMVAGGVHAAQPDKPALGTVQSDGSVRRATASSAHGPAARLRGATKGVRQQQGNGTFMQKLELRWERRRERGDF